MSWRNNEDAGDLEMMGAADFSGHLGELEAEEAEEAAAHEGCECPSCGEPMSEPTLVWRFVVRGPREPVFVCEGCA